VRIQTAVKLRSRQRTCDGDERERQEHSSSARASVRVTFKVDGIPMEPGQVVYCDRPQAVGVTLNTGLASDNMTIELFFGDGSRVTGNSEVMQRAQPAACQRPPARIVPA